MNRVRVAKDKTDLVRALTATEHNKNGTFPTYADAIAFAAALGAKRQKRSPLAEIAKREPSPISVEIFVSRGYETLFYLFAVIETGDRKMLSPTDAVSETQRVQIFEEYANGGLEILREELRGAVDYTERLALLLVSERFDPQNTQEEFDLGRFLQ